MVGDRYHSYAVSSQWTLDTESCSCYTRRTGIGRCRVVGSNAVREATMASPELWHGQRKAISCKPTNGTGVPLSFLSDRL
jgi:hypothetical protein